MKLNTIHRCLDFSFPSNIDLCKKVTERNYIESSFNAIWKKKRNKQDIHKIWLKIITENLNTISLNKWSEFMHTWLCEREGVCLCVSALIAINSKNATNEPSRLWQFLNHEKTMRIELNLLFMLSTVIQTVD